MNKPDPTKSCIPDIFNQLYGPTAIDEFESLKENGTPQFLPEDPISSSTYNLDVQLLKLVKQQKITLEYFSERYKDYALRFKGYHIIQTSNNKSNLLKALKMGNITMKKFQEMCRILNLTPKKYHQEFETAGDPVIQELNCKGEDRHD